MKTHLSVVIPCYNEEANLKKNVLSRVDQYLGKQKYSWEVIVSDDGSSDKSLAIASAFAKNHQGFRVLKNRHGGKPWAVWQGIRAARGEIVLFTDMDQSTPIEEVGKLLPWFGNGFSVVIGSRGLKRKGFPFYRQAASVIFRLGRGLFMLGEINDTQCGFKAFKTEVAKKIFPQLQFFQEMGKEVKGWRVSAFDVELLFIAKKRGYKIKEVVVDWKDRDAAVAGKKKNYLKESTEMAKEIWRVKRNNWQKKYD